VLRMEQMVDALPQRVDRLERLVAARAFPIFVQLSLMLPGPIADKPHRSRRKLAGDDGERFDVDRGFVVGIACVEVWLVGRGGVSRRDTSRSRSRRTH
jgi:hypothetical protein